MGGEGRKPLASRQVIAAAMLAAGVWPAGWTPAATAGETAPRFALSSGMDVTANSRFGYAGGIWAPGRGLDAPGFRLQALGGVGAYDYDGSLSLTGGAVPTRFDGDVVLGELLAGYQWRRGEWTAKAYAGVQVEDHAISPDDPANAVNGAEWGVKGQLELWRNLGAQSWLSLDASYGTAFESYRAQARIGRRVYPWLSLGVEAGGLGNAEYDAGRGGGFLRLHLAGADVTLAGGVTRDYLDEDPSGYVSLGMYRKF